MREKSSPWRGSTIVCDLEWDPQADNQLLSVGWQNGDKPPHAVAPGNVPHSMLWDKLEDPDNILIEFTKSDAVEIIKNGHRIEVPIVDLQVLAWILDENQKLDLEHVVKRYLRRDMDKRLRRSENRVWFKRDDGKEVPIGQAPKRQLHAYCKRDVETERDLYVKLIRLLDKRGWLEHLVEEQIPFTRVLVDMHLAGVPIDVPATEAFRDEMEEIHDDIENDLRVMGKLPKTFNIGSDDQVRAFLFQKNFRIPGHIPVTDAKRIPPGFIADPERKPGRVWLHGWWHFKGLGLRPGARSEKTGEPSISRTALLMNPSTARHPWVLRYLEYQKLDKLLSTYLRVLPRIAKNGRIHTDFNQTGTVTGRLSSRNPNMQNMPARGELGKRFRGLFRTTEDFPFIIADQSQLETRLMADASQDPFLLQIFREDRDPFIEIGSRIFGKTITKDSEERSITKNVWYAQGYGAYAAKVAEMLTMEGFPTSYDVADEFLTELQGVLPVYFGWREDLIEQAKVDGYVETIGGHYRRIKFKRGMEWKDEGHGERAAANAYVQGSAADIVRRTMLRFSRSWLWLLLQVHDELMYQYCSSNPDELRIKRDIRDLRIAGETGHGFDLSVPLRFEPVLALSWAEKG